MTFALLHILRLNARLTGHRLLRGMLVAGGVAHDFTAEQMADARATVARVLADFDEVVEIAMANGMVLDRLHGAGRLTNRTAREMQVVGVPARASGIDADARRDHPFAAYAQLGPRIVIHTEGDVWARLMVRVEEARESARLITRALENLPAGKIVELLGELPEGEGAFGLVEGWRGPIWHGRRGKKQFASACQGQRPIVRELARGQLRDPQKHRAGLSAGQQELQSVVRRE